MALFGFYLLLMYMLGYSYEHWKVEELLFYFSAPIGFLMPLFSSLFFGAEYSDGTMRNKLIVGHSRESIYLAALMTNIAVAFLMCFASLIPVMLLGIPIMGEPGLSAGCVLLMLLGSFLTAATFASFSTLLSLCCSSKTVALAIGVILVLVLFFFSGILSGVLAERIYPDELDGLWSTEVEDILVFYDELPYRVQGAARVWTQFWYDISPTGQLIQYASCSTETLWQKPIYSIITILLTTRVGLRWFQRKDIK